MNLTIRTLPELPTGAKYRCVFGGAEPIDAGVTSFGLTCPTPSFSYRPKIPEDQDHILVPLSVRSSETNKDFVSRNFAYFNCGSHKKCTDCVKSNWACYWCVYQNLCMHNASECHGGTIISGEKVIVNGILYYVRDHDRIIKKIISFLPFENCILESDKIAIAWKKFVSSISHSIRTYFITKRCL